MSGYLERLDQLSGNRQSASLLTIDGRTQNITYPCSERGISLTTFYGWWPVERPLEQPTDGRVRKDNRLLMLDGRQQRITDWAREIGLEPGAIRNRLKSGMRR